MDAKTSAKNKTGTLTVGNNNWDMPIYPGTIGPDVVEAHHLQAVDLGKLVAEDMHAVGSREGCDSIGDIV